MLVSSNRHILPPDFLYPSTLQNKGIQMLWELRWITALKLKDRCRIFLLANPHPPQAHIPCTSCAY